MRTAQVQIFAAARFTHNDPFEDTERDEGYDYPPDEEIVSPTTIRSRILKVKIAHPGA